MLFSVASQSRNYRAKLLRQSGKKSTLRSLPDESFSGLQLMCLMHSGFQPIAPEQETGMDLAEPFLTALELFQKGESDAA